MFPLALLVGVAAILALTMGAKSKTGPSPAPGPGPQPQPGGGGVSPSGPIGPGTVTPASGPSSPLGILLPAGSTVSLNSGDAYFMVLQAADYDTSSLAPSDWSALGLQQGDVPGYVANALDAHFFPNGQNDWTEANFDATSYPGYYVVFFTSNVDGTGGGPMMSAFSLTNTTSGETTASASGDGSSGDQAADVGFGLSAPRTSATVMNMAPPSPGMASPAGARLASSLSRYGFQAPAPAPGAPHYVNPLGLASAASRTAGGYVPPNRRRPRTIVRGSGPSGETAFGGHGGTPWPRDDDLY